jgi:tetratricopeptide (TPR) repeat protein
MRIPSPKTESREPKTGAWIPRFGFRIFHHAFLALLLTALPVLANSAKAEDAFQKACSFYASGNFNQAATSFRELVLTHLSSGVLHNLGNAEWKCGHAGEAVLAWERAQWLDPFDANTRANLRFARKAAQLTAPDLAWYEICSTWLPVNAWAWLAGGGFWLALALVMLPGIFRWRKAGWQQALSAGGFAVFLLALPALLGVHSRAGLGVVRAPDTPLRLTPTSEAQVLTKLPAGEMARLERERGSYVYIRAANDAAGWVRREEFGLISREKPQGKSDLASDPAPAWASTLAVAAACLMPEPPPHSGSALAFVKSGDVSARLR